MSDMCGTDGRRRYSGGFAGRGFALSGLGRCGGGRDPRCCPGVAGLAPLGRRGCVWGGGHHPVARDLGGAMAAPRGRDPSARGQRPGNWRPRDGLEPHRGVTPLRGFWAVQWPPQGGMTRQPGASPRGRWPSDRLEPHRGVTRYRCQLFQPGLCVKGGRPFRAWKSGRC